MAEIDINDLGDASRAYIRGEISAKELKALEQEYKDGQSGGGIIGSTDSSTSSTSSISSRSTSSGGKADGGQGGSFEVAGVDGRVVGAVAVIVAIVAARRSS